MQRMMDEARRMLLARRAALMRRSVWATKPASAHSLDVLELGEIDAALERIENQTFGRCEQCGCSIGRLRLRALPETRLCVSCATAGKREARNQNTA